MPSNITTSMPQNQPFWPTGLTTMFTITVRRTMSSHREIVRMRRMRADSPLLPRQVHAEFGFGVVDQSAARRPAAHTD
jgi:hypothetical protein